MDKILLLLMLTGDVNQDELTEQRKRELEQREKSIKPAPAQPRALVCIPRGDKTECKVLTQAEISGGAVRGNKEEVDEQQP